MFKSTSGGANWRPTGLTNTPVYALAVDPRVPTTLYAVTSSGVVKSLDGGDSWTDLSDGLPAEFPASAVAAEGGANNGVYVGLDEGIYYRNDTLPRCVKFSDGLPNVVITALMIQQPQHRLIAATFGRGVWVSDLYSR